MSVKFCIICDIRRSLSQKTDGFCKKCNPKNRIMRDRIDSAVERGEQAFWEAVARHFPEAKTGDFEPLVAVEMEAKLKEYVRHWVDLNVDRERKD